MNSAQNPASDDIYSIEYVLESPYPGALYSLVFSFKTPERAEIVFNKMSEWGLPILIKDNVIRIKPGSWDDSNLKKTTGIHLERPTASPKCYVGIYFNNTENAAEFFKWMKPVTDKRIKNPDMLFFGNSIFFDTRAIYFSEEDLNPRHDFKKRVVQTEILEKYIFQLFLLKYVCNSSVNFPIEIIQMIMYFNVIKTIEYPSQINHRIQFNKQFPLAVNNVAAKYKKKYDCHLEYSVFRADDITNRLHLIFANEDEAGNFYFEMNYQINSAVQLPLSYWNGSNIKPIFNEVELSNKMTEKGARLIALDDKTVGFLFETACEAEYIHGITRFNVYTKDNQSVVVEPVLQGYVIKFPLEKLRKRSVVFRVETSSGYEDEEFPQMIKRIDNAIQSIIEDLNDGWKTQFYGAVRKVTFWVSNEKVKKSKKMLADITACLNVLQAQIKKDFYIKSFAEIVSDWKQSDNVANILNNEWAKRLDVNEKISELVKEQDKSITFKHVGV